MIDNARAPGIIKAVRRKEGKMGHRTEVDKLVVPLCEEIRKLAAKLRRFFSVGEMAPTERVRQAGDLMSVANHIIGVLEDATEDLRDAVSKAAAEREKYSNRYKIKMPMAS